MFSPFPQRTIQSLLALGLILLVNLSVGASDRVLFKTWNTENGLPQNSVNRIVQTPDGYLWLATFDGLARFDGARFKIFKKSNTPPLPMNRIAILLVDAAGRLWIWTEDPNTIVLYEQGKFRAFLKGTDFDADHIYNVTMEEGGPRFPFGDDAYVYNQGKFERRSGVQSKLPRVFQAGDPKVWWVNTNEGYYAVNDKESTFYPKDGRLPLDPRKATVVAAVEIDGGVWFVLPFSAQGFRLCVFRNGRVQASSVSTRLPKFFTADREGNFWIGDFYDGVRKIPAASIRNDDLLHLKVDHFSQANGLASDNSNAILADREGNIWIGTDKGLQLLIDEPLVTVYSKASGLPSDNIYSIAQDQTGAIWFGAWDAYLVKYANNVFTPEPKNWVQALFVDRASRLWVGAAGGTTNTGVAALATSLLSESPTALVARMR